MHLHYRLARHHHTLTRFLELTLAGGILLWLSFYATNPFLVKFKNEEQLKDFASKYNINLSRIQRDSLGWALLPLTKKAAEEAGVAGEVQENRTYYPAWTPDDPSFSLQWGLSKISAPAAWDWTRGSSSVTVAVLDTGIATGHSDLAGKMLPGKDFVNNDNDPRPQSDSQYASHGTVVAGIVAAATNNSIGVAGTGVDTRILPIQVLSDSGIGSTLTVRQGIIYAADQGANVINLSLGTGSDDPALKEAIDYAYDRGVVIVAAAGNGGGPGVIYPAAYPNVLAVGATNSSDQIASFSSSGPEVDVSAPGVSVYSTAWSSAQPNGYSYSSGTSMATPHVAAVAALSKAVQPGRTNAEIYQLITGYADKPSGMGGNNYSQNYGYGRVNSYNVVMSAYLTHPDGSLVKSPSGPEVYLVENGQKRHIASPPVFESYGYRWDRIRLATVNDMALPTGPPVTFREGTLVQGSGPQIYVIDQDGATITKRHIMSAETFQLMGFRDDEIMRVDDDFLPSTNGPSIGGPDRHPDGSLIKYDGPAIYLIENGQRRHIGSPAVFESQGLFWNRIKAATSYDGNLANGGGINYREGTLIKSSAPPVYVINYNGVQIEKRHITSPQIFTALGYYGVEKEALAVDEEALPNVNGPSL